MSGGPGQRRSSAGTGVQTPPGGLLGDPLDPDTLAGPGESAKPADELRALIHEAHEAIANLAQLIDVERRISAAGADEARGAAYNAGRDEVGRFIAHLNGEMHAALAKFDGIANRARQSVIASIRPRLVQIDPSTGWVTVQFDGGLPSEVQHLEPGEPPRM
jgi:hypothetical protein